MAGLQRILQRALSGLLLRTGTRGSPWPTLITAAASFFLGKEVLRDDHAHGKKWNVLNVPNAILGLGGTAAAGGLFRGQEKLETALANVSTAKDLLSAKELELMQAKQALVETQSSVRELQEHLENQKASFLAMLIILTICVIGMAVACLCQKLHYNQRRHKMAADHSLERERAMKERIRQQAAAMEEHKASLHKSHEERRFQQQMESMRGIPPGHQPLIFTIPPGVMPPPVVPAFCDSTNRSQSSERSRG
ncbi:unknown protein [Seminavis robusta]|uniref:Uncharacterized protein n=1 Tax=Seminavis robusta TaxID=568900 RepID=A0A9N8HCA9_9STRA|nr:unknown protein [Seminavis robusta]|eukprot:Sro400_g135080.1 n/a (251) ;mRNA; f:26187-26939